MFGTETVDAGKREIFGQVTRVQINIVENQFFSVESVT